MKLEDTCGITIDTHLSSAAPVNPPGSAYRPKFRYRCYRKVAGVRLTLVVILFVITLPFTLVGLVLRAISIMLVRPTQILFTSVLMPEFVRLAYVHRLGAIHPKLSRGLFKLKRPHSRPIRIDVRTSKRQLVSIHTLAQLSDNLGYLIVNRTDPHNLRACVVDCGDADACRQIIAGVANVHYGNQNIHMEAILTTHHHWDHMGGNEQMKIPRIYAGKYDRVRGATYFLDDHELFQVAGIDFEALHTPCHTRGSMVYRLVGESGRDCLFLGDTLFCGGCGAFFEGSQLDMHKAFAKVMLHCNDDSLLFPGHEYTEQILMDHFPIKAAQYAARAPSRFFSLCSALCRAHHLRSLPFPAPTVPVRLSEEVLYNATFDPVLRCCLLLKECLFSLRPCGATRAPDPTPSLVVSTPEAELNHSPDPSLIEIDRLRPKVAKDDHGQIVVVEPPWIIDHSSTSSPFVTAWREDLTGCFSQGFNSHCSRRMVEQRHLLTTDQLKADDRRTVKRSALFKGWPTSQKDVVDAFRILTDSSGTHIPLRTLELAVTQTLDQELPAANAADLDKLGRLFASSVPSSARRKRPNLSVPLSELVTFVGQQLLVFEDEAELQVRQTQRSSEGPGLLRLDESIQVHDFTACRICQCQPVRGGARQLELARTGTTYSSRRHGLTTIITAADSDLSRALSGSVAKEERRLSVTDAMRRVASFPATTSQTTSTTCVDPPSPSLLQLPHGCVEPRRLVRAERDSGTPASARDDIFLAHRLVEGKSLLMFSGDFDMFDADRELLGPGYLTMATLSSIAD